MSTCTWVLEQCMLRRCMSAQTWSADEFVLSLLINAVGVHNELGVMARLQALHHVRPRLVDDVAVVQPLPLLVWCSLSVAAQATGHTAMSVSLPARPKPLAP